MSAIVAQVAEMSQAHLFIGHIGVILEWTAKISVYCLTTCQRCAESISRGNVLYLGNIPAAVTSDRGCSLVKHSALYPAEAINLDAPRLCIIKLKFYVALLPLSARSGCNNVDSLCKACSTVLWLLYRRLSKTLLVLSCWHHFCS